MTKNARSTTLSNTASNTAQLLPTRQFAYMPFVVEIPRTRCDTAMPIFAVHSASNGQDSKPKKQLRLLVVAVLSEAMTIMMRMMGHDSEAAAEASSSSASSTSSSHHEVHHDHRDRKRLNRVSGSSFQVCWCNRRNHEFSPCRCGRRNFASSLPSTCGPSAQKTKLGALSLGSSFRFLDQDKPETSQRLHAVRPRPSMPQDVKLGPDC